MPIIIYLMSLGQQQLVGLLQKADMINSGLPEDGIPKQITIKDSDVERLMVGIVLDLQNIKTLVIKYQSPEKGFYCYDDWLKLHDVIFDCKLDIMSDMWRVLKLINFGDEFIPSGLIFDSLVTLFNTNQKPQESEKLLRNLFFKFIELNGKSLTQKEKDDIEYLKVLRKLIDGYRDMIAKKVKEGEIVSPRQQFKPRYQRLHQLHNVFTYKKNLKKLQKIDDQMKNYKFQPELFESRKHVESRYLMTSTNKTYEQPLEEEELFETRVFRANPIPDYPDRRPKGYTPHVTRMKQFMERQHQKSISKPILPQGPWKQFQIQKRDRERKQNSIKNQPILFEIQVDVGKKKFWIKVRRGMSEEQVVKQIEMLAGFSDRDIITVVEQYFINYYRKSTHIDI